MTETLPEERPNCKEILNQKDVWVMNGAEIEINNDMRNILLSEKFDENFNIYSVMKSKLFFSSHL